MFPNGLENNFPREEYFNYKIPLDRFLFRAHLATVFTSGLLAATQFVPRIRSRFISYHRAVGPIINALNIISTLSAMFIARVTFGGDLSIQSALYVLGLMTLWSTIASWRAIRCLQIDEHRKWVIRAWGYQASVLTLRVIMFIAMTFIGHSGGWYMAMACAEVANSLQDPVAFAHEYPQCLPTWPGKPVTHVAVEAGFHSSPALAASGRLTFGMGMWVGLWIHAVGIEYYLFKTENESKRLRDISAKRQAIHQKLH